jgi:hypothetical protein
MKKVKIVLLSFVLVASGLFTSFQKKNISKGELAFEIKLSGNNEQLWADTLIFSYSEDSLYWKVSDPENRYSNPNLGNCHFSVEARTLFHNLDVKKPLPLQELGSSFTLVEYVLSDVYFSQRYILNSDFIILSAKDSSGYFYFGIDDLGLKRGTQGDTLLPDLCIQNFYPFKWNKPILKCQIKPLHSIFNDSFGNKYIKPRPSRQ